MCCTNNVKSLWPFCCYKYAACQGKRYLALVANIHKPGGRGWPPCAEKMNISCQGENFTFALEILDQLIDALSDENESES